MKWLPRKRIGAFLGKCPLCSPALLKSQGNVIEAGLRHWHFTRIFLAFYLEDRISRAYTKFFFSSWDAFPVLVCHREVLKCSLSKSVIQRSSEKQLLWKFREKSAYWKLLFSNAASSMTRTSNFSLI